MTETSIPSTRMALVPALLRLAAPVVASRLGFMGMGIVDTIVVGQIAPHELGYLALGWAPTWIVLVAGMGLLNGVQVLGARALGEGKPDDAGIVWRRGMVIALVLSGVFAALMWFFSATALRLFGISDDLAKGAGRVAQILALSLPFQFIHVVSSLFLESIKRPTAGTVVIWIANGINLVLNLMFVPSYGAVGSAFATIGGRAFMAAALLAWVWYSAAGRDHGARKPAVGGASYSALLAIGAASAVSQVAEAGAFNAMSVMAARLGEASIAAYQILLNILAVVFMVAMGFSTATSVLVSEAYGAGDYKRMVKAGWTGLGLNTIAVTFCAFLAFALAYPIARGFTSDTALIPLIAALIPLCALIMPFDGGQVVAAQALRGRADNWFPTASHIVSYVVIMPPLGYWLAEHLKRGVTGLMQAILIASAISVALLCARFWFLGRQAINQTPNTQPSSRSTS